MSLRDAMRDAQKIGVAVQHGRRDGHLQLFHPRGTPTRVVTKDHARQKDLPHDIARWLNRIQGE